MCCSKNLQNKSCRVAISFGWTSEQLFKGKSVTRRHWKDSYAQQFINRWHKGITTYLALDKGWRQGGQQIGTITLTCCPYKERLCDMPMSDVATEGFPELNQQEFIERFFKGDDQQQVWVIRFRFTPLTEESCTTGISSKLDIDRNTENAGSSPGGKSCTTGISGNAVGTELSLIGNEQPLWEAGVSDTSNDTLLLTQRSAKRVTQVARGDRLQICTRVCHKKSPGQAGTVIKAVVDSTRYSIAWDAGGKSAVEGRNLTAIPVEQGDPWKLLTADPDYLLEVDGQFMIFSEDEPPYRDDFASEAAYLKAWAKWELQYPELAKAVSQARSELQTIPVEQKSLIPVVQDAPVETIKVPKTRNTKPGRGSRPKQVKCNVKRNNSKNKVANRYWVYKFSFKVDGRYYDRSVSIPKEKVNQVISMWESSQYSWRDIVEYIGKSPDKIIDKAKNK